jgi:hypothetical protein
VHNFIGQQVLKKLSQYFLPPAVQILTVQRKISAGNKSFFASSRSGFQ